MIIKQLTSMTKILQDDSIDYKEFDFFTALKNERFAYQIALRNDDCIKHIVKFCVCTDMDCVDVRREIYCYANSTGCTEDDMTDEYIVCNPTYIPDALFPVENNVIELEPNENAVLFVTAHMDTVTVQPGKHYIKTEFDVDGKITSKVFTLDVINANLPSRRFMYTNWFHCDSIAYMHNEKVFTERFWHLLESYMLAASRVGMNMILTPIITPPLDTEIGAERLTVQLVDIEKDAEGKYIFEFSKFRRWVELAKKCGMKYFEMAHLFTQWGAKCTPKIVVKVNGKEEKLFGWHVSANDESYADFLHQFMPKLVEVIRDIGIENETFFHISDEPSGEEALEQYEKCKSIVSEDLKGFRIMDALSHPEYYERGVVTYPVPLTTETHKFLDFDLEDRWTYYCCGPAHGGSNRFLAQHGWVTRAFGSQLFKFNIDGFLHWGLNFYFTRLSKQSVSPYEKNDYENFPQGDGCIIYPYKDGAVDSLRGQLFYDALQDRLAMELLSEKLGRETVIKMADDLAGTDITFGNYPHGEDFILSLRSTVNEKIRELYA